MKPRGGPPFSWWILVAAPHFLGYMLMNSRGGPPILRGGPPLGTISWIKRYVLYGTLCFLSQTTLGMLVCITYICATHRWKKERNPCSSFEANFFQYLFMYAVGSTSSRYIGDALHCWNGPRSKHTIIRYLSRFFDCLAHPNLSAALATDQKWSLSCLHISYKSLAEYHLP